MAPPVSNDEPKKDKGVMSQMSEGMDKGIHTVCNILQQGNWKSVAVGAGLIAVGLIGMFVLMPKMGIDFNDLNPSSIMLVAGAGALCALGLKGIFSPLTKNMKVSPQCSRIMAICLSVMIPVALAVYGGSMTHLAVQQTGYGTNGCFWVGIISLGTGIVVGAAYLKSYFWDSRTLVTKMPKVTPADSQMIEANRQAHNKG